MANPMTSRITGMPLPAPFLQGLRRGLERLDDGPLAPALDLYATRDAVVAKLAVPGVGRPSIDVAVGDDFVTISGSLDEGSEGKGAGYVHRELIHGSFSRSFWLPTAVSAEAAKASLENGLLTLTLPRLKVALPPSDGVRLRHVEVEAA
jgi:HSP20 family molecular chaperone IbpA